MPQNEAISQHPRVQGERLSAFPGQASERNLVRNFIEINSEGLFDLKGFLDIVIHDLAVLHGNDPVADSLLQQLNRPVAHLAGNHPIAHGGIAAPLNVAQHSAPCRCPQPPG